MINKIVIAHLNVRSLLPKIYDVHQLIISHNIDILCVSETWLSESVADDLVALDGFVLFRCDRDGRAGGVAIYVRSDIRCQRIDYVATSYEQIWVKSTVRHAKYIFGCVYKPPSTLNSTFLDEFESQLVECGLAADHLYCAGDININMLDVLQSDCRRLNSLFLSLNLTQLIVEPTRTTGTSVSLLDIILVSTPLLIAGSGVINSEISDHDLVYCRSEFPRCPSPTFYTYRDFSSFNKDSFLRDLRVAPFNAIFNMNLNEKIDFFKTVVVNLFNAHSPVKTVRLTKKKMPWITDNIKLMQRLRDKAKARFRRTKSIVHWNYYKQLRNFTTVAIRNEKRAYFEYLRRERNSRCLWRELSRLHVTRARGRNIPPDLSNVDLINDAFVNCVPSVVDDPVVLADRQRDIDHYLDSTYNGIGSIFSFSLIDSHTVLRYILSIRSVAVGIDGISINMLKLILPYALPYITHIINCCLEMNIYPQAWRSAIVLPLPKVSSPTRYDEIRPISILPALSKVLERAMYDQFSAHLTRFGIVPSCQSGFRSGHSCETALLRLTDDILCATDQGKLTAAVLLDYSKAFDAVHHPMLLSVLHFMGCSRSAIDMFGSFLSDRSQCVRMAGRCSTSIPVHRGVPQGSILGPLLFSIYTCRLPCVVEHCQLQMYADDVQIYLSFPVTEMDAAIRRIELDLDSISRFSVSHTLSLNVGKTKAVLFGGSGMVASHANRLSIRVNNQLISFSSSVKNLGLIIDNSFRYRDYISRVIGRAYNNLKILYAYRQIFSIKLKKALCETMVLSLFNYCAPVYGFSLDAVDVRRVQVVQNSCMRYIFGIRKYDRISHKLRDLRWLNMRNRVIMRSLNLFHRILIDRSPPYLLNKITYRTDVHNINLRRTDLITAPVHRTSLFERGFSFNIYWHYNRLPYNLKLMNVCQFRCAVYNYLFTAQ